LIIDIHDLLLKGDTSVPSLNQSNSSALRVAPLLDITA
jgi:hypothetical protein